MRLKLVPENTNYNFFRYVRISTIASILSVVISIGLFVTIGPNYGVDFRGGTLVMAATPEAHPIADYRAALNKLNVGDVGVTEISDTSGADRHMVLMRLGVTSSDAKAEAAVVKNLQTALSTEFTGIEFLQVDSVGAKVSSELVRSGIVAVILSFLSIMVYVWLRFEWQFAIGAVLSLMHDTAVAIGVVCLLRVEFDLTIVAAVLTIIGYSINDTVVVFDRVRENLRKYKKMPLQDVMNLSMNETLSRTIMTSMTTLIALISVYFLGGSVVSGFALTMIVGVVTGTYSSIYVATAIVVWLGVKRDWSKPDAAAGTRFGGIKA